MTYFLHETTTEMSAVGLRLIMLASAYDITEKKNHLKVPIGIDSDRDRYTQFLKVLFLIYIFKYLLLLLHRGQEVVLIICGQEHDTQDFTEFLTTKDIRFQCTVI